MSSYPEPRAPSAAAGDERPDRRADVDFARSDIRLRSWLQSKSEYVALALVVAACLAVGLMTVRDYGMSWDEPEIYRYGDYAVQAYRFFLRPHDLRPFPTNLNLYGPAYFMAANLFARSMHAIHPGWSGVTLWHLFYFLTFLAGAVLVYLLCRRSLGTLASLGACLLFVAQPLFWGHAFMNPKDLPFMVFFLASVYLGLEMVDHDWPAGRNYALVAAAGITLGLSISIRSAAPLAGALVGFYALSRSPRRAMRLLAMYAALACVIAYATWPFLWGAPFHNFLQSLSTMSQFPFQNTVLFMGRYYDSTVLPWFYYPVILGLQLTLPAILLAVAGLGVTVFRFVRRGDEKRREPLLLFVGWFLIPAIAIITLHSSLYDNARQLFFLLPPLFLLIGVALESFAQILRGRSRMVGLLLLCIIPGVRSAFQLHPYEYVYYNELAGGTGGAYRHYEMDYWATSFEPLSAWLNQHATAGSVVWVQDGSSALLHEYLSHALTIACKGAAGCAAKYDYVIQLARWGAEASCGGAEAVLTVQREGAVFAVLKELRPRGVCSLPSPVSP